MAALSVNSRRLPGITQRNILPIASVPCGGATTAYRTATPRDVPGSRLLPTHRAAMLQSGSPPGVWSVQRAACLQPFCVPSSSFTLAFLCYSSSNSGERSIEAPEFLCFVGIASHVRGVGGAEKGTLTFFTKRAGKRSGSRLGCPDHHERQTDSS